jgi:hypothetical protein
MTLPERPETNPLPAERQPFEMADVDDDADDGAAPCQPKEVGFLVLDKSTLDSVFLPEEEEKPAC